MLIEMKINEEYSFVQEHLPSHLMQICSMNKLVQVLC